jgi:hypothetical protein
MTVLRAEYAPAFYYGDDVVLLVMDRAGATTFAQALSDAEQRGSTQVEVDGKSWVVRVEPGHADIALDDARVTWHLDTAKAAEIRDYLNTLGEGHGHRPSHHYVDITAPADTLVLSRDEYTI